jgi:predicted MPP superfamily phosphohydrolase
MKRYKMLIFFTIALLIYSLANLYLFLKGYHAISEVQGHKTLYSVVFFSLATIFIIAKFLETRHSSVITDALNIIGGFWLAFMLYGILLFLLSDIVYLLLRITGTLNAANIPAYRKWSFVVTVSVSSVLIIAGFINAIIPVVTEYNIKINKSADVKSMRIAAVSDIHLGSIIRRRSMKKLSRMLDNMKPDLVLLLGDIIDGEIGPVLRDDLLQYFTCPKCTYGMLAITGNHEFIGGASRTIPYIESKGIRMLKDEVTVVNGGIQLIGRTDRDSERYYGRKRMPLAELMLKADTTKPVILLDHQPVNYDESVINGIDLELSGHTHDGQMWPLNHITRAIYELSYGYMQKDKTHFIVSSGYGLWGPRVRIGTRSEVLLLNLEFTGPATN